LLIPLTSSTAAIAMPPFRRTLRERHGTLVPWPQRFARLK
jgi:hypothetical protein